MHWQFTTTVLLYVLSGAMSLATAWMASSQRRRPGVKALTVGMLGIAVWSFWGAFEVAVVEWSAKTLFAALGYSAVVVVAIFMFFFVFEYYGWAGWLTPRRRWLLWLPGSALVGLALTNAGHGLIWTSFLPGPEGRNQLIYLHGPAYYPLYAYLCLLIAAALAVIVRQAVQRRGAGRRRAVTMAFALAIPLAASLLYSALPHQILVMELLPVGFALAGILTLVIVYQDVADQIEMQTAELRATIATLQTAVEARQQVEERLRQSEIERQQLEVDRLRSELLANVSHELRTPLGLILLTTTMLIDQDARMDHETRVGFLRDIEDETQRLRELVDNLLDLSRLRSGRIRLNCHPTDLARLVQDTAARLAPSLEGRRLTVELPAEPLLAWADHARIEQVLRNLLINAALYSLPGAPITLHGVKRANDVLLGVSDKGSGIAAEDLPHLFERFYRAKNVRTQQTRGAGLGLSICKGLVEAHGGRIWVESQPGMGSTFFFTTPLDDTEIGSQP
jgi:signal transduction histidine kinase